MSRESRRDKLDFDWLITIVVVVFIVAGFGLALGYFLIALAAAAGIGLGLAAIKMLLSRSFAPSYLGGVVGGLLLTFLFYAMLSFFVA